VNDVNEVKPGSLRVLVVHQLRRSAHPSGEDAVFIAEIEMLRRRGHTVETFTRHSDSLHGIRTLLAAAGTPYNPRTARDLQRAIGEFRPDVVHFHNIVPSISPASVRAAKGSGCAVVLTLHSYGLFCASAMLHRDGGVCELCLGRAPWPALRYACYRGSRAATLPIVLMQALARRSGVWTEAVHRFIAPSQLVRGKAIEAGLDPARVVVKPHVIFDAEQPAAASRHGCIFVGRLGAEKGITTLLEAWQGLPGIPLRIVGSGPLDELVRDHEATRRGDIQMCGKQAPDVCRASIAGAKLLVFSSVVYETFGLTVGEALACGTPVVVSRGTAAAEHVEHGVNGLLFERGDAGSLRDAIREALGDEQRLASMGEAARQTYLERFTPERNHEQLTSIYRHALEAVKGAHP
jgi:glycosyltransferase involved in cell wall biosynthesis